MTAPPRRQPAQFAELEPATAPPEARQLPRDAARLLVSEGERHRAVAFGELPGFLEPGDLVVVNESATRKAAVDLTDFPFTLHVSSPTPQGTWIVELRTDGGRTPLRGPVLERFGLVGGARVRIREAYNHDVPARLWIADIDFSDVDEYLATFGRFIRYPYVTGEARDDWYQTIFARVPGSAEMPSAGRGFTPRLVERLAARGVEVAPLVLHTGVSSQEEGEAPHAEWYEIGEPTRARLRAARRIIAVGTTVVRALETLRRTGSPSGYTDLIVRPDDPLTWLGGVLSGFHPPRASHLDMLTAFVGSESLRNAYELASRGDFRSHEFGDFHLMLRAGP